MRDFSSFICILKLNLNIQWHFLSLKSSKNDQIPIFSQAKEIKFIDLKL